MSGNLQRTDQDDLDLELVDSVTGSATACTNISRKLLTIQATSAGCLSRPLSVLASRFSSMSKSYTTATYYVQHRGRFWCNNISLSVRLTQERCQHISIELSTILDQHGEWDVLAAVGCCRQLNAMSKSLQLLMVNQELLFGILDFIPVLLREPVEHASSSDEWSVDCQNPLRLIRGILHLVKERSKELLAFRVLEKPSQTADSEDLPMLDDWSTTQSTTGIMTPTEDWSDLDSDTTETGHAHGITRHSLQLCEYAAANFLELTEDLYVTMRQWECVVDAESIQRLHKAYDELITRLLHALDAPMPPQDLGLFVSSPLRLITKTDIHMAIEETRRFLDMNNDIEGRFGHLPGSRPVAKADVEVMHRAFDNLVVRLFLALSAPVPFQDHKLAPAPAPAPVSISVSEVPMPVVPEAQSEVCIDKTLEAIIDSMESEPTEEDIMKLVFHWTTLDECNGFKRAEVMKFD